MQKLKEKTPKQHDQNEVYFSPVRLVSHLKLNQLRSLYSQNFKTRKRIKVQIRRSIINLTEVPIGSWSDTIPADTTLKMAGGIRV